MPSAIVLHLDSARPYEVPALNLIPFEQVRIICTDVVSLNLAAITVGAEATLTISGTVALTPTALSSLLGRTGEGTVIIEGDGVTVLN
eukprot:SAG22_NODE_12048_length_458_cov_1.100279_1_plen_87_part_10